MIIGGITMSSRRTYYKCPYCGSHLRRYGAIKHGYLVCINKCTLDENGGHEMFFEDDFRPGGCYYE